MKVRSDARPIAYGCWIATALVAALGFALLIAPGERRIRAIEAASEELYNETRADEQVVASSAALATVKRQVEADLATLPAESAQSAATSAALRLIDREAKTYHVSTRSVGPGGDSPADRDPLDDQLLGQNVELRVEGGFASIVAFVADASKHDVLLDARSIEFHHNGDRASGLLDATIVATIYRFNAQNTKENAHVTTVR